MASFLPRKGKKGQRWQAIVRLTGHPPQYKTFTKKLDAQRWAHKLEEQIHGGLFQGRQAEKITLGELRDWYVETVLPARGPRATDKFRLEHVVRILGERRSVASVGGMDWVKYARQRLKEGVSSDTVRRELDTAADMFTSAVAFEVLALPANPVTLGRQLIRKLRVLKPKVKRARRLKPGEEQALMAVERVDLRTVQDLLRFNLETTMRRRELALMRPEHWNRQFHTLRLWETKTDWMTGKEGREIPLSPVAEEILARQVALVKAALKRDPELQKKAQNGDKVAKAKLERLSLVWGYTDPHSITRAFRRLVRASNQLHKEDPKHPKIEDLRLHDFRHEAITRLFEKGYTVEQVMVFSGHLDEDTVHDYTHMSPAMIAAKMR